MKGGDILDFLKGGNLRKGGVDPEKEGYTPLTNYAMVAGVTIAPHFFTR